MDKNNTDSKYINNKKSYQGHLLAAHPNREEPSLQRGVMLILEHVPEAAEVRGAVGFQINKHCVNPEITLGSVMQNLNLDSGGFTDIPVYWGGYERSNQIYIIHTLDWATEPFTIEIAPNIGITNDFSIMRAISKNRGPEKFRAISGYSQWAPGHLEGEIGGTDPWKYFQKWGGVPATESLTFDIEQDSQWTAVLKQSAQLQIDQWFASSTSPFQS